MEELKILHAQLVETSCRLGKEYRYTLKLEGEKDHLRKLLARAASLIEHGIPYAPTTLVNEIMVALAPEPKPTTAPEESNFCPQCGPKVAVDEDGCCKYCGADCCIAYERSEGHWEVIWLEKRCEENHG